MIEDTQFLAYCESHVRTDRAGFLPEHLARLYRLAGEARTADAFAMLAESIAHSRSNPFRLSGLIIEPIGRLRDEIENLVQQARERETAR